MDRRSFMSLFTAASVAAVLSSSGLVEGRNSEIELPEFDLRFQPPNGWHKYTGCEILEAYAEDSMIIIEDGVVRDASTAPNPILSFTRVPEPVFEFNPQIMLCCDRLESPSTSDLVDAVTFSHEDFQKIVPEPKTIISPRQKHSDFFPAAEERVAFRFETQEGLVCRAIRHVEIFAHQSMLYAVVMTNASNLELLPEQIAFLDSIRPLQSVK